MVIEGHLDRPIEAREIEDYLSRLSRVLDMTTLLEPVTHQSDRYGWAGWIHWETSGAHFYAWDEPRPFFSVDIYTCKAFDALAAASFTVDYFKATDVEFEEFPKQNRHAYLRNLDVKALAELLISLENRPDRDSTPFGTYIVDGDSAFADLGRYAEIQVFSEFFGNDAAVMSAEYDAFDTASRHIVVLDHSTMLPAGSIRVIHDSPMGFKSLIDMSRTPEWNVSISNIESFHGVRLDRQTTMDLATIAVLPEYRNGVVSPALFHGLYWYSLQFDVENVVGIGDVHFIEMCWALGTPCKVICDLPALAYLDSPESRPLTINVSELRAAVREGVAGPMIDILRGAGVAGSVSLPKVLLSEATLGDEVSLATAAAVQVL